MSLKNQTPSRNGCRAAWTREVFRTGCGGAGAHYGELLQGAFVQDGRLHRGLFTLPCPLWNTTATFKPNASGAVTVEPGWMRKAAGAAKLALEAVGRPDLGGHLNVQSDLPPGWGAGSSTSHVEAAIRAAADAAQQPLSPESVAELAVRSETASDSIMFGRRAVLFAHREGRVLESFPNPLPALAVVGGCTDPTGAGVETLVLPPARYDERELGLFQALRGLLRRGLQTRDVELIGQVATASARINQRSLPVPRFEELLRVAERSRAVGVAVAHSGSLAAVLFASDTPADRLTDARAQLEALGYGPTHTFKTRA